MHKIDRVIIVDVQRAMAELTFRPIECLQEEADGVFRRERDAIRQLLPTSDIQHVGATAIPGSVTKGDVDLAVRVEADEFPAAVVLLERAYEMHQPENWTPTYASFKKEGRGRLPIGVQLSVRDSPDDFLVGLRDKFRGNPSLVEAYNDLKRSFEGRSAAAYSEAKHRFIADVLGRRS